MIDKPHLHNAETVYMTHMDYAYNTETHSVVITQKPSNKLVYTLTMPSRFRDDPEKFIELLQKSSQCYSLIYSQNRTLDISRILDREKMPSFFNNMQNIASSAFDFCTGQFQIFTNDIIKDYKLQCLKICEIENVNNVAHYYKAKLKTIRGVSACVRSEYLNILAYKLSAKIADDIIPREFSYGNHEQANNLITLSSRLNVISKITDPHFDAKDYLFKA